MFINRSVENGFETLKHFGKYITFAYTVIRIYKRHHVFK